MRVAVVHERLTELGGSERVAAELAGIWPDASLFVPIADASLRLPGVDRARVRTSWLQRLYRGGPRYSYLLPLLPAAMATTTVDADVVVTSHHAFANRVRVRPGTTVVSYTHTPPRWMWDATMRSVEIGGRLGTLGLGAFAATQRHADRAAAQRADVIVANSSTVAERVRRWWGRDAVVVHPPIDTTFHHRDASVAREDFFLLAGRLVPYKRPEVAAAAAAKAGVPLVVAGGGRAQAAVEAIGGPGVRVLGPVTDHELRDLYRRCRALVFPGIEDFGMIPVEAMACGAPVLALGVGGVRDSVVDGVTGQFVAPPAADIADDADLAVSFAEAMAAWDDDAYDPAAITAHAQGFSASVFRERMRTIVQDAAAAKA